MFNDNRTNQAIESDKLQNLLATQRERLFNITFIAVIVAEAAMWYFGLEVWVRIIVPIMWIGFLIHNNSLLLLHELWELNDQLSGRKDELRKLLQKKDGDEV